MRRHDLSAGSKNDGAGRQLWLERSHQGGYEAKRLRLDGPSVFQDLFAVFFTQNMYTL